MSRAKQNHKRSHCRDDTWDRAAGPDGRYGIKGDTYRAAAELAEARRASGDDRFSSIASLKAVAYGGVPKIRALFEAIYYAGLRKAGMPEE